MQVGIFFVSGMYSETYCL